MPSHYLNQCCLSANRTLRNKHSVIWINMYLRMLSAKWQPFYIGRVTSAAACKPGQHVGVSSLIISNSKANNIAYKNIQVCSRIPLWRIRSLLQLWMFQRPKPRALEHPWLQSNSYLWYFGGLKILVALEILTNRCRFFWNFDQSLYFKLKIFFKNFVTN